MSTGIRRKVVQKNTRIFNENARRYIFYPMSNLDLSASQHRSPIWNPKIKKGTIHLLESFPYVTQVVDDDPEEAASRGNGVKLGERIMGTNAQVSFLMGNAAGTGYMERGMVHIVEMLDVDYETAENIEKMLLSFPIPNSLNEFEAALRAVKVDETAPEAEIAAAVQKTLIGSVRTAINYCRSYTASLEKELREGQAGKIGIKALEPIHEYYFNLIDKPLPEDRAGVNTGNQIAQALRQVLGQEKGAPQENSFEKEIEMEQLKKQLEEAQETIKEQGEVIESLTTEEEA